MGREARAKANRKAGLMTKAAIQEVLDVLPDPWADVVRSTNRELEAKGIAGQLGFLCACAYKFMVSPPNVFGGSGKSLDGRYQCEVDFLKARLRLRVSHREGESWKLLVEKSSAPGCLRGVSEKEYWIERLRELDLHTTPTMNEKTRLIRELLEIGRGKILADYDAGVPDGERFSYMHEGVVTQAWRIAQRMLEIARDSDPGFVDWFFSCDALSLPEQDQDELSALFRTVKSKM